jgi:hypothetical protein
LNADITEHSEAREVVIEVWREVEFYYRRGTRERMRKHAREWGVIYARKGGEKRVSGTITDAQGKPVPGAKVKFENGNNKTLSDAQGKYKLITNLLHEQTLVVSHPSYEQAEVIVDLLEGEENHCDVRMG